jgi:hypothetical protein
MFSYLKSADLIDGIEYKTRYTETSYNELSALREKEKKKKENANPAIMEEIDIELVLRSFDRILGMGSDITKEQAMTLCYKYLEINPYHDFFNLALALHIDSPDLKEDYLLNAARSRKEDKTITAQAALELAKLYASTEKYLESQAWLSYAVILGNEKAVSRYKMDGAWFFANISPYAPLLSESLNKAFPLNLEEYKDNSFSNRPSLFSLLNASVIAITLSGKKLAETAYELNSNRWISRFGHFIELAYDSYHLDSKTFAANQTSNILGALSLYKDSSLGSLACDAFYANPALFRDFFTYCKGNRIISNQAYELIMIFMANYPYTHQLKNTNFNLDSLQSSAQHLTQNFKQDLEKYLAQHSTLPANISCSTILASPSFSSSYTSALSPQFIISQAPQTNFLSALANNSTLAKDLALANKNDSMQIHLNSLINASSNAAFIPVYASNVFSASNALNASNAFNASSVSNISNAFTAMPSITSTSKSTSTQSFYTIPGISNEEDKPFSLNKIQNTPLSTLDFKNQFPSVPRQAYLSNNTFQPAPRINPQSSQQKVEKEKTQEKARVFGY